MRIATADVREKVSSNSADLFAGVGLGYHFSQGLGVTVDYLMFNDVGDEDKTGEGDIKSFRIGVTYTFPN